MTKQCINVSITGAAGHIGYALLFRIASGAMFGPNVKVRLQLIELESQLCPTKTTLGLMMAQTWQEPYSVTQKTLKA